MNHKKQLFLIYFPALLIFLSWILLGWVFVNYIQDYAVTIQKDHLFQRVRILSASIDINEVKGLSGDMTDTDKLEYKRLKNQLMRVVKTDSHLRFAYFMARKAGNVIFLVDSEPEDSKDYSPPGQVYDEASAELRSLFDKGEGFIEGPLSDRWGTWVSALMPIRENNQSKPVAVMGLDVDSSIWKKDIETYRTFAIIIWLSVLCIIFLSLFFFYQQRKTIDMLRLSEERFRDVTDSSGDWIWETNQEGLYVYSSYGVKGILGYDPHEIIGKKYFYDFCFPEDTEYIKKAAEKALKEKRLFIREIGRRQHKDGHEVILDIRGFAVRPSVDGITGYRGVDRDITDLKKAEDRIEESRNAYETANRELEANEKVLLQMLKDMELTNKQLKDTQNQLFQSEKMASIGVLASGTAHEIKNPLAIILQGMERIGKILSKGNEGGSEYVTMVRDAAVRANKVVDALLRFSRSSHLDAKPLDITEAIEGARTLVEARLKQAHVKIDCQYQSKVHTVNGDMIVLEQVFFDLFMNAIDAMPQGGEITVTTSLHEFSKDSLQIKKIIIEVKDTGIGIESEHLSKIFDPFFTTKEPGKGTGLGLSTVYLILERHQGTIRVESTPEVGTKFIITLPVLT